MSKPSEEPPELSNLAGYYQSEYHKMLKAWDTEDFETCYSTAEELLEEADLPIFYAAGCHLFLADEGSNAIYHATCAVKLYNEMADAVPLSVKHQKLLQLAESTLRRAKELGDREDVQDDEDELMAGMEGEPESRAASGPEVGEPQDISSDIEAVHLHDHDYDHDHKRHHGHDRDHDMQAEAVPTSSAIQTPSGIILEGRATPPPSSGQPPVKAGQETNTGDDEHSL